MQSPVCHSSTCFNTTELSNRALDVLWYIHGLYVYFHLPGLQLLHLLPKLRWVCLIHWNVQVCTEKQCRNAHRAKEIKHAVKLKLRCSVSVCVCGVCACMRAWCVLEKKMMKTWSSSVRRLKRPWLRMRTSSSGFMEELTWATIRKSSHLCLTRWSAIMPKILILYYYFFVVVYY